MPSLALKKVASDILLLYTYTYSHWREKKMLHILFSSVENDKGKDFNVLSHVAVLPVLWGHTKGKCESGEICPVKTNAIVQHFGKTSSGYAWLWSPIAEKDEVKEGAKKGWYGGYGPQSLLKEEFDSGHTFF